MSVNHKTISALPQQMAQYIEKQGGSIPFDDFMRMALYAPEQGYYASTEIFGAQGDFVTAPALGPWLSLGLVDVLVWGWQQLGSPKDWSLLEQGGGNGQLLLDVVQGLAQRGIQAPHVISVEGSRQLRDRQQALFASHGLQVEHYAELSHVPHMEYVLMFSNELPDAFPVRCFTWNGDQCLEREVAWDGAHFVWRDGAPVDDGLFPSFAPALTASWPKDYHGEWNPQLQPWQEQVASCMGHGFVFCVDYGYTHQEYYRSQRVEGTLMGHHQHQVVHDVLTVEPGQCDITAHVDFSMLAAIGKQYDLQPCVFTTQGAWLAQSPSVQARVQDLAMKGDAESVASLAQAKRLMLPLGMGESFKLLVQSKGVPASVPNFLQAFDRLDSLVL